MGDFFSGEKLVHNCVSYGRVSSKDQVDNYSLGEQKENIADYVKYKRYNLVRHFEDAGISGKNIESRKAFNEMIQYIESKKDTDERIDAILVWKLSRFSRSTRDLLNILHKLEQLNCHLIATSENIDTSQPMGEFMLTIIGAVAQMERKNIVSNAKVGQEAMAKSGLYPGGVAAFGYKSIPIVDGGSNLGINRNEAKYVIEIFDRYLNKNHGYTKITKYLNLELKLKTRKGYEWSTNTVKSLLQNPVYAGKIRYGMHKDWSEKRRSKQDKEREIPIYDGKHEAIISWETFQAVQDKIASKGGKPEKYREGTHLLSGTIICPWCKEPMVSNITNGKRDKDGNITKHYYYYKCGKHNNKRTCKANSVHRDIVDEEFKKLLFDFVDNPDLHKILELKLQKVIDVSENRRALEVTLMDIKALESQRKKAVIDKTKNDKDITGVDDSIYDEIIYDCARKIKINQEMKLKHEAQIALAESQMKTNKDVAKALKNFKPIFEHATLEQQRRLVKSFVKKVHVHKSPNSKERSKIKSIEFHFNGEDIAKLNVDLSMGIVDKEIFGLGEIRGTVS